jgi:hypothetical protein
VGSRIKWGNIGARRKAKKRETSLCSDYVAGVGDGIAGRQNLKI